MTSGHEEALMSKPPRRRLHPEARKLEIVEAAERLLQANGGRARVEDVVREAGVAKGTFFLYFPTWDDLLETIRQRLVSQYDAANPLPTEVEGQVDWPRLVESQALAFIAFTLSRRGVGEAVFHSDFAERRPLATTPSIGSPPSSARARRRRPSGRSIRTPPRVCCTP